MKCSVCGSTISKGRGKMYVRNDGKIFYFCDSKCQKNWRMGRSSKKMKWVSKPRKTKAS